MKEEKQKTGFLGNLSWKFAERFAAQSVSLIVSVILARLLEPSDYGTIAIVNVAIAILNVFVSDGFGSALIQKKDADILDFSSVLYFNIGFSCILYFLLFLAAPFISAFYGDEYEALTAIFRVLGLRLIFSAINSVQNAYVSKKMIFRKFFWATFIGTAVSAGVGIAMAYLGCGVWALVFQYLTSSVVNTIVLAVLTPPIATKKFSFERLKGMLGFGSGILGSNLLTVVFQEMRTLIIGKMYAADDLAFFDKGKQFPNLIVTNINVSISAVLFPKMSHEQTDKQKLKAIMKKSVRYGSFIMCPLMLGMLAIAEPFVELILTEKWMACVPFLRWFCIYYLFQPIHTTNMQAIKALGRADIYFKLEVAKKIIEVLSLVAVMWISVDAIVISMAVLSTVFTAFNAYPTHKLLGYSFKEQTRDMLPAVSMAVVMVIAVCLIGMCPIGLMYKLPVQIIGGGCVYCALAFATKNQECAEILMLLRSVTKKTAE